ncbi:MAG: response regulator, partial [Chloroflexi bacterium]|nr:response regulator [Chloroflexota bacterium]
MKVPILVATPNEGFGELISQIIHDSGGYSITLVKNGADAMKQMKIHAPALCIVDAALEDIQILDLTHQIRAIEKDVFLIVIPSGDINNSDQNEDIQADGFLPVPFYNPDLLSLIEEILKKKDQKESEEELK